MWGDLQPVVGSDVGYVLGAFEAAYLFAPVLVIPFNLLLGAYKKRRERIIDRLALEEALSGRCGGLFFFERAGMLRRTSADRAKAGFSLRQSAYRLRRLRIILRSSFWPRLLLPAGLPRWRCADAQSAPFIQNPHAHCLVCPK